MSNDSPFSFLVRKFYFDNVGTLAYVRKRSITPMLASGVQILWHLRTIGGECDHFGCREQPRAILRCFPVVYSFPC